MEIYYRYRFLIRFVADQDRNAIFCFHGFIYPFFGRHYGQTSKKLLSNILKAIRQKYKIISLSELIKTCIREDNRVNSYPKAAFTVDDGLASILDVMDVFRFYSVIPSVFICPKLMERGALPFPETIRIAVLLTHEEKVEFPANYGITTLKNVKDRISFINRLVEYFKSVSPNSLESELEDLLNILNVSYKNIENSPFYDPILEWKQIKSILSFIEVGSHTCNHFYLSSLSDSKAKEEITESKRMIEDNLSIQCSALAYPFGNKPSFGEREEKYARESDYQLALSLEPGFVTPTSPLYRLPRFNAGNGLQMLVSFH